MIQIYWFYFLLILFVAYLLGLFTIGIFGIGKKVDQQMEAVLGNELQRKIKRLYGLLKNLRCEYVVELKRCKLLEQSNESIMYDREQSFRSTFAEMHKNHNKILVDEKADKVKIPEVKKFKRRKLGAR